MSQGFRSADYDPPGDKYIICIEPDEAEKIVTALAIVTLSSIGADESYGRKAEAYALLKRTSLDRMIAASRWARDKSDKFMLHVDDKYIAAIYACMKFEADSPADAEIKVEFEKKQLTITKA